MSLLSVIQNIQNKPLMYRKIVTISATVFLSALTIFGYVTVDMIEDVQESASEGIESSEELSPMNSLSRMVTDFKDRVAVGFERLNDQTATVDGAGEVLMNSNGEIFEGEDLDGFLGSEPTWTETLELIEDELIGESKDKDSDVIDDSLSDKEELGLPSGEASTYREVRTLSDIESQ